MIKQSKIIEENRFGIKRTDNRLCLICAEYIFLKEWEEHLKEHDEPTTTIS